MAAPEASEVAREVKRHSWYHTLDLGHGVVTPGMFDHRSYVHHYMLPEDLTGKRCLDVGTMDGFWAYEMERRGATDVLALDLADPAALDWPVRLPDRPMTLDETKRERFDFVRRTLGSKVERIERSVYDLDADLGPFDFVFCGDLLCHLKDPITALERMRQVCQGTAVLCTPTVRARFRSSHPIVVFDGIDDFRWWLPNDTAFVRMVRSAGFDAVEAGRPFKVPPIAEPRGGWNGRRTVVRGRVGLAL